MENGLKALQTVGRTAISLERANLEDDMNVGDDNSTSFRDKDEIGFCDSGYGFD